MFLRRELRVWRTDNVEVSVLQQLIFYLSAEVLDNLHRLITESD